MNSLAEYFLSGKEGGYAVAALTEESLKQFKQTFSELGATVLCSKGESARTTGQLFTHWAEAFQLPDYFGRNWDALSECLGDHECVPRGPHLLIVTNAEQLLQDSANTRPILARILSRLPLGKADSGYAHMHHIPFPPLWMLLNLSIPKAKPRWMDDLVGWENFVL